MPLRAVSDAGNIHAFEYDAQQWTELKQNYRSMGLRIPCCGVSAVPKTSTLGNFFFAHARKGECTTAPESAEHLYCKQLIAQAAQNAGWTVTTERSGVSPSGDEWVADVFCEKGSAKIALEVQMSPQTLDETIRRQQRYKESGVRAAWLLGPKSKAASHGSSKDLPAFTLGPVNVGEVPIVERFRTGLSEFVVGMLNRRLAWVEPMISRPLHVEYLEDTCWQCKKPVKQVYGHLETIEDADKWQWHERPFTVASVSVDLMGVMLEVDNSELAAAGLNPLVERTVVKGKPTKWGFSNLCLHCQAPQDNFHLGEKLRKTMYGITQDPDEPGFEIHEEPLSNPPIGLVQFARSVKGPGRWEFSSSKDSQNE